MANKQVGDKSEVTSKSFDQARNELFSHILRCGVLDAAEEHRNEWFEDTMEYLAERYGRLAGEDLIELRRLGERFCRPIIRQGDEVGATN